MSWPRSDDRADTGQTIVQLTVTVDDAHRQGIGDVVRRLHGAGMQVGSVLEAVGLITGSAPRGAMSVLAALEGVAAVHEELRYHIAPPQEDIQ